MRDVKVNSREYKMMLRAGRFAGDERQVLDAGRDFWRDAKKVLGPVVLDTVGSFTKVQAHRTIRFFDTSGHDFNNRAYIFRERADAVGDTREVTLKFRHPDRYIAADRDMNAVNVRAKTKFEEDIKPEFQQLYSYSTTVPVAPDRNLAEVKHVVQLFPGLKDSLAGVAPEEPLAVVDRFTARELVIGGASLHLGKRHNVLASCVLVIWYDNDEAGSAPEVAEFSFKYGDPGEAYGGGTVRRAYDAFLTLQSRLGDWTDKDSKTKTAFVYG